MDSEVVEVLKEIRDEAKQTNTRLEALEGRFVFLEKRVTKGFEDLGKRVDDLGKRVDTLAKRVSVGFEELKRLGQRQNASEMRFRTEMTVLTNHEKRITALERRVSKNGK